MNISAVRTRIFQEGEDIVAFIIESIPQVEEGAVVVVTSKIVALAEGARVPKAECVSKEALIRQESEAALETKWTWLTLKDGMLMAAAGIDESNAAEEGFILLPCNSMRTAHCIYQSLRRHYGVKNLGVVITDSRTLPLRAGVTGVALGYAGFYGVKDYRGTGDIFGRTLQMTRTNYPDGLAAAAVMLMGEGAEQQPLALITGADLPFTDGVVGQELTIPLEDDLYRPLLDTLLEKARKQ